MWIHLPPLLVREIIDLVSIPIKSNMEIGDRVVGQEYAEDAGVRWRVRVVNIANLKVHFECATSCISPQLQPDLIWWDHTIMPSELASTVINDFLI